MSKISMIHHINIQITDRERTREWYERVLGAQFLDRGPALNQRMLQLRIGSGEIHTSETTEFVQVPRIHFAVEVEDWDGMMAHLQAEGVACSKTAGGAFSPTGNGDGETQGRREDTNEHYTYIADPDRNMIELVYHPLGLVSDPDSVRWTQTPGFVEEAYQAEPVKSA